MKAPDRSVRWSRGFVCNRLFFSFEVWWNLWLRCETQPGVRELLKSWQFFVVLFSALLVMMCGVSPAGKPHSMACLVSSLCLPFLHYRIIAGLGLGLGLLFSSQPEKLLTTKRVDHLKSIQVFGLGHTGCHTKCHMIMGCPLGQSAHVDRLGFFGTWWVEDTTPMSVARLCRWLCACTRDLLERGRLVLA